METIIPPTNALFMIAAFFFLMLIISFSTKKRNRTKVEYLLAGRTSPWIATAFSMAATWVWAPSLFVASEKSYLQGFAGFFWFVVPNILTLILFAYFAQKMRRIYPDGFTFSGYIQNNFSKRVHNLFLVESFGLQICSMAVQLLAGGLIFHKITGLPFTQTTILLSAIPLLYSVIRGLRGNIITDFVKMGFIVAVLVIGLPIITSNVGFETLLNGLGGISGNFSSLFDKNGVMVMLSFGIPTTIGLLSGTFGDQMFWQRAFCVKAENVKITMILAAIIFGVVPVSLSLFGFFAAGAGLYVSDTQLVNVFSVINFTPGWFLYLFFLLILAGLISTVDSILCAVSSVAGHDIVNRLAYRFKVKQDGDGGFIVNGHSVSPIAVGRMAMVAVSMFAVLIANIKGITITYLFLLYGTLRSSVMLPTIFAIQKKKMHERGLFYGIITSLCIGLPVFAYGNLNGNIPMIITGSLVTILASGILSRTIK